MENFKQKSILEAKKVGLMHYFFIRKCLKSKAVGYLKLKSFNTFVILNLGNKKKKFSAYTSEY